MIFWTFLAIVLCAAGCVAWWFFRNYFSPSKSTPQTPITLSEALSKTSLLGALKDVNSDQNIQMEELEEALYTSDLGPRVISKLLEVISQRSPQNLGEIQQILKQEIVKIFEQVSPRDIWSLKPQVWLVAGVNGVGKTTTIGKLAYLAQARGFKTLLVGGDTFRAAARQQLKVWSDRSGVEFFSPENMTEPAALAFGGCEKAKKEGFDLVIVDTAGRLHNQSHLMDELKKVRSVVSKAMPQAPHETLIVLDANTGQNAVEQAQVFQEALLATGLIFTKVDGTARGGVAVGLVDELQIPVYFLGTGEGLEDLQDFSIQPFVQSLF